MKIDLGNYFEERDRLDKSTPGPYLTISRQYGCESNKITIKLLHKINMHIKALKGTAVHHQWKFISKEIIDDSAEQLGLASKSLEQQIMLRGKDSGGNIFMGLSRHYNVKDKKLFGTIREIIDDFARVGNVIILGRAGAAMTQDIPNGLHLRLIAPLEYRIRTISQKKGVSEEVAKEMIIEMDKNRETWTENLSKKDFTDSWFDLILNRATLSEDEIVNMIFSLMQERELI